MRSSIDVIPESLAEIVTMLKQFGVSVVGSQQGNGVVCLTIEGDIVPDEPKVMIGVQAVIGKGYATLTARCEADRG